MNNSNSSIVDKILYDAGDFEEDPGNTKVKEEY